MAVAFLLFITACVGPLDRSCGYKSVELPFASPQHCERFGHMEAGRIAAFLDGTLSSVEVNCRVKSDNTADRGPAASLTVLSDR
ncbi:hypothetical protein HL658_32415 [Azospirillum sp. RWY-5-1]|uniref:Lipoprotein n=1 Tax=Azospirillum oleiclasticum TaxID=2735135 RepID=A0ABX2TGQ5_9PROT|nr:hypothetical protein [Azospirillum oleiclasticum]NYZ17273.1 hypothetical protein [Azospirillum oleiclasticum]NYZ23443.1 hypothetical protein [Azospirillum oleiclasticum]